VLEGQAVGGVELKGDPYAGRGQSFLASDDSGLATTSTQTAHLDDAQAAGAQRRPRWWSRWHGAAQRRPRLGSDLGRRQGNGFFALEERGNGFLARLSPLMQKALCFCLSCWR
jgi:hypothetical protein